MEEELAFQIVSTLGMDPTDEQRVVIEVFSRFYLSGGDNSLMLLRGSAGTGKTTIASAIVQTLLRLSRRVVLLAPTGRAAKVFEKTSNHKASTIHRHIYRQRSGGENASFCLNTNLHQNTLFIVDEASMIANESFSDATFGSGRLLDDLLQYTYNDKNCRLMLIGDKAQLPPVGCSESPALSVDYLEGYGKQLYYADMNQVVRQAASSGILYNATQIRQVALRNHNLLLPKIELKGFADIVMLSGYELIETLEQSYSQVGIDETIVVTRSNKAAVRYNDGIRYRILDYEEALTSGDYLMVVKNKYLELPDKSDENTNDSSLSFIANGDRVRVRRVRNMRELYGFRFADLTVEFVDYDSQEMELTTILDALHADAPALTKEQQSELYARVAEDYADIPRKSERYKKIREDKHYSALQVKYAYAVTCHKAQGGQWAHVYIDKGFGMQNGHQIDADFIHWLYTAFTRATEKLFLINWEK